MRFFHFYSSLSDLQPYFLMEFLDGKEDIPTQEFQFEVVTEWVIGQCCKAGEKVWCLRAFTLCRELTRGPHMNFLPPLPGQSTRRYWPWDTYSCREEAYWLVQYGPAYRLTGASRYSQPYKKYNIPMMSIYVVYSPLGMCQFLFSSTSTDAKHKPGSSTESSIWCLKHTAWQACHL